MNWPGLELYYKPPVTEVEARKLGDYLSEAWGKDTEKSVEVRKQGDTYQFRMVTAKKEVLTDPDYDKTFSALAHELSEAVFEKAPVEIDLCNEYLRSSR